MYTIDVIGSCISRDILNSQFVSNYSDYFKLKTYVPRMSIPSIISDAENVSIIDIKKISENPWQFECFYKICQKNCFEAIENNQSDILLIDFYSDSRIGIYITDDCNCITANRVLRKKMFDTKELLFFNYCNNKDQYFEMWKKSFDCFMEKLKDKIPDTHIVVNGIKGTNLIKDEAGNIFRNKITDEDCNATNELWQKMEDYAVEKYNLDVIKFPEKYYLDLNYIFGGAEYDTVHFHLNYYRDMFSKLLNYADSIESNKLIHKNHLLNLVPNNDFRENLKYWDYRNGFFELLEQNSRTWIQLLKSYSTVKSNCNWIWSNPIEINADGKEEYTLSFDFIFNDKQALLSEVLFGIRLFEKSIFSNYDEAVENYSVHNKEIYTEIGKIYHVDFVFNPRGKYIRVAPHFIKGCSNILFSNICLLKGRNETYIPWKKDVCNVSSFF